MLAEVFLQAALGFLSREVPKWARENHCYSCHNNGDGARALFRARALEPLTDKIAWLRNPGQWDEIHGAPAASDRKLAQVQFSAALDEAYRDGAIRDVSIL